MSTYLEIPDGLRSWYEKWPKTCRGTAFVAASLLALLEAFVLLAIVILVDLARDSRLASIEWIYRYRIAVAICGLALVFANVTIAKKAGIYGRVGAPRSNNWKRPFLGMLVFSTMLLAVAAILASAQSLEGP